MFIKWEGAVIRQIHKPEDLPGEQGFAFVVEANEPLSA